MANSVEVLPVIQWEPKVKRQRKHVQTSVPKTANTFASFCAFVLSLGLLGGIWIPSLVNTLNNNSTPTQLSK